jgi:ubiquinone/menaquinone biosynthesis C-methylase UbiE
MSAMQWATPSGFPTVYEELNVPAFFTTFAELMLDRARPAEGERILDVATGTGIVLRCARSRTRSLAGATGLDLTPAMLEVAREKSAELDIDYVEGDATALPFPDGSFDLVTCQQGLQFFPDRLLALREFRRVLADGGRVVIACWCEIESAPGHHAIAEIIATHLPELAGAAANPFSLPEGTELDRLLREADFDDVQVERVTANATFDAPRDYRRSYMDGTPLAIALAEVPEATRATIAREIEERIASLASEPVVLPMSTNIATAIRLH